MDEGEPGFRDKEEAVLASLCTLDNCVIATGGGVVLREANRQRLRSHGKAIWLTADPQTILQRIAEDATSAERRPMLTTGGKVEIVENLQLREPLYRACADVVIDTERRTVEDVAGLILAAIYQTV
jgi:shikimate kinase